MTRGCRCSVARGREDEKRQPKLPIVSPCHKHTRKQRYRRADDTLVFATRGVLRDGTHPLLAVLFIRGPQISPFRQEYSEVRPAAYGSSCVDATHSLSSETDPRAATNQIICRLYVGFPLVPLFTRFAFVCQRRGTRLPSADRQETVVLSMYSRYPLRLARVLLATNYHDPNFTSRLSAALCGYHSLCSFG